jgi:hypothetical protein
MKPQVFLRFSLLLPYLLWGIMLLVVLADRGSEAGETTGFFGAGLLASMYVIGIIFWFLPYTLLALGLVIWSLKKQPKTILRVFALSPLLLTVLILLEINLLSLVSEDPAALVSQSNLRDLMSLNLLAIGLTLGAGYLCVGLGFGLYKLLQRLNIFRETDMEAQPLLSEAL